MITRQYRDATSGLSCIFALSPQKNSQNNESYHLVEPLRVEYKQGEYSFVKYLGNGAHCKAQLFGHELGATFVVKSPTSQTVAQHHINNCRTDLDYLKLVYPQESAPYSFHPFKYLDPLTKKECLAFFALLPYFPGDTLHLALQKATSEAAVLKICQAMVLELQRIHDLGILHGDIRAENILVQQDPKTGHIQVHFIDFEWAYRISDTFARKTDVEHKDVNYFPKERTASHVGNPAPAFEQDVFSLGYWLNYCLETYAKGSYSSNVKTYCMLAMNEAPQIRPSLQLLLEILEDRIAAAEVATTQALPLSTTSSSLSTTARLMQNGIGSSSPDASNYDSYSDSDEETPLTSTQTAAHKKIANTASSSAAQTLFRTQRSANLAAMANSPLGERALLPRTQRSGNLAAMVSPPRG